MVLPDLISEEEIMTVIMSQCTYRCVVLPDRKRQLELALLEVSMHLQVRGAP